MNQNYCEGLVQKTFHETCLKQNTENHQLERRGTVLRLHLKWSPNRRTEAVSQAFFQKFCKICKLPLKDI